jgi:hypothetical protein
MIRSDFVILSEVRREVARTEAVLESIQFGVTRGVVYFAGEFWIRMGVRNLERQKYYDALVSTLVGLEKRIRRIAGVRDIFFRFTNVDKQGGFWRRLKTKKASRGGRGGSSTPTAHNVDEDELLDEKDEERL